MIDHKEITTCCEKCKYCHFLSFTPAEWAKVELCGFAAFVPKVCYLDRDDPQHCGPNDWCERFEAKEDDDGRPNAQ